MRHSPGKPRQDASEDEGFEQSVAAKEARMRRSRRMGDRSVWFGLGMFGVIGWTITIPVLLGTFLGVWLDGRTGGGIRWTLGLMALGFIFGGVNAWNWIEKARTEGLDEAYDPDESDRDHGGDREDEPR